MKYDDTNMITYTYTMHMRMRTDAFGSDNITNLMQRMKETKDDDARKGV